MFSGAVMAGRVWFAGGLLRAIVEAGERREPATWFIACLTKGP